MELEELANCLLTGAIQHTPVWRRVTYGIDDLQALVEDIRQGPVPEILPELGTIMPGEQDPYSGQYDPRIINQIVMATVVVEEFNYSNNDHLIGVSLSFIIIDQKDRQASVRILSQIFDHKAPETIYSTFFFPDWFETGYEGHGGIVTPVSPDQLEWFTRLLLTHFGSKIDEPDLQTWLEQQADMTSVITGITYHYDQQRGDWFSDEGVPIDDDPSGEFRIGPQE